MTTRVSGDGSDVRWLAKWFESKANGVWEHDYGVTIATLDNPGWSLRIDLGGTALRNVPFPSERYEEADCWRRFWKDDDEGVFHAIGDATALPAMIERFRRWVTENCR